MGTATVSASIDTNTKTIANAYIRQAGTTPNELIKRLWENIALTGTVPEFANVDDSRQEKRLQAFRESQKLMAKVPRGTVLDNMSYEDMRKELENRDI